MQRDLQAVHRLMIAGWTQTRLLPPEISVAPRDNCGQLKDSDLGTPGTLDGAKAVPVMYLYACSEGRVEFRNGVQFNTWTNMQSSSRNHLHGHRCTTGALVWLLH